MRAAIGSRTRWSAAGVEQGRTGRLAADEQRRVHGSVLCAGKGRRRDRAAELAPRAGRTRVHPEGQRHHAADLRRRVPRHRRGTARARRRRPTSRSGCRSKIASRWHRLRQSYQRFRDAASDTEPTITARDDDRLYIMYTSGTTGLPKGVVHTHNTAMWGVLTIAGTTHYREHERYLACLPMFHVGALTPLTVNVYRGAASIVMRTFDPVRAWELIESERITCGLAVPAMLNFMLQVGDVIALRLFDAALVHVRCGAGAGTVDRGLREARHRGASDLRADRELRARVSDRPGTCAEEDRLDRQSVLPHGHPRGQRGGRRLRARAKPARCGCAART